MGSSKTRNYEAENKFFSSRSSADAGMKSKKKVPTLDFKFDGDYDSCQRTRGFLSIRKL